MATILIIGSVACDEVIRLHAPLRAGSHNGGSPCELRIGGGAANTAMALARGGDLARVISAVGDDPEGATLITTLEDAGVDTSLIDRTAKASTRSLVMLDPAGERTVVNLTRAVVPIPVNLDKHPADALYIRSADPALRPLMDERCQQGLVVAHVPPLDEGALPAQVLVCSASDLDADFLADPFAAGRRIAGSRLQWIVVTRGADGATAYGKEGRIEATAPKRKVIDSTGAGDVFAAGLLHALAAGREMEEALRTAIHWGSASVTYAGTVPPPGFPSR
jgi:sugar/nucleoside kinase (ribokinase family)